MLRTEVMAWLDFNPINELWVHTEVMAKRTDWQFEKLTYQDNEGLPASILADLLQHKGDGTSNWWRVYGLGEIGALEGNVYQGWVRHDTYKGISMSLKRYWVDFGYNDPTTIMAINEDNNQEIYLKTKLYQSFLTSKEIVARAVAINAEAASVCGG